MKKIQTRALYFIFIAHVFNCFSAGYSGMGSDMGAYAGFETVKIAGPILEKTAEELSEGLRKVGLETVQAALPSIEKLQGSVDTLSDKLVVVSGTLATAIQNAGANAGVGLADKIGSAITATCMAGKSTGTTISAAAAANPVITTVIVGGIVVVIIAYGSYKIYRYYRPVTAQIDEAKMKLEIAKAHTKIIKLKAVEEKEQKEAAFKQALIKHASSKEKTANGVPLTCQKAAQELAIISGQKKVDKIIASFNKYAPDVAKA